jgi:tRNA threonylcarbamoyladenosine biosynthesis protein TsaB
LGKSLREVLSETPAKPVLVLDASTARASIAILRGRQVLAETAVAARSVSRGEGREERIMPAVAATLAQAGVRAADLGAVIVGAGPGGFTSLRIAAAIAKGIADAVDIPMGAIASSLLVDRDAVDAWPEARVVARMTEAVQEVEHARWEPDYGQPPEAEVRRAAAMGRPGG